MKKWLPYSFFAAFAFVHFAASAQNLKGIWTGDLRSDTTGVPILNTQYILNIKEQTENTISGSAYVIEKRFDFEGILDFIGIISNNVVKISELRIISSRVPLDIKHLCIKTLALNLSQKDGSDYLQGPWTGYEIDGSCIPGMAILRRHKLGEVLRVPAKILNLLADRSSTIFLSTRLSQPTLLNVRSSFLEIEMSDYLREDMDTVSVYVNRKAFIRRLAIKRKPEIRVLRLDTKAALNEIVLLAENLGRIPPNTSVLTINDGFTRQRVIIQSTKEISAVIYLRYQPPK